MPGVSELRDGWVEDSTQVASDMPLSKREILGLVLTAYAAGPEWTVGYDPSFGEPNDGYLADDDFTVVLESKLVPRFVEPDAAIRTAIDTYEQNASSGQSYGEGRVLLLSANAGDGRARRVSALADEIEGNSPFEKVLFVAAVARDGPHVVFHVVEQYPTQSMTQVDFNFAAGIGVRRSGGVELR